MEAEKQISTQEPNEFIIDLDGWKDTGTYILHETASGLFILEQNMGTPIPQIYDWLDKQDATITDKIESIAEQGERWRIVLKNNVVFILDDWHDIPGVIAQNPQPLPAAKPPAIYPTYDHPTQPIVKPPVYVTPPEPINPYSSGYYSYSKPAVDQLQELLGPIAQYPTKCPVGHGTQKVTFWGKHGKNKKVEPLPGCAYHSNLWQMVQHLNDRHMWSREKIADWMETLDIDLTLAHILRCEYCQKTYHGLNDIPPLVCSPECGEKLAQILLDNPELKDMPDNKRAMMIQAFRELDNLEEVNEIGPDGNSGT